MCPLAPIFLQEISSAAQLLEAVDKGDTARVNSLLTCPEIVVNACNKVGKRKPPPLSWWHLGP